MCAASFRRRVATILTTPNNSSYSPRSLERVPKVVPLWRRKKKLVRGCSGVDCGSHWSNRDTYGLLMSKLIDAATRRSRPPAPFELSPARSAMTAISSACRASIGVAPAHVAMARLLELLQENWMLLVLSRPLNPGVLLDLTTAWPDSCHVPSLQRGSHMRANPNRLATTQHTRYTFTFTLLYT